MSLASDVASNAAPPSATKPDSLETVHCMRCGYLLRGLDPAGVCPECGVPIVETIDDLLRQARRQPRPWPQHAPLHELGAARLVVAAAGAGLLALVFLGVWPYAEMLAARQWYGPSVDPDHLLVALGFSFCLGAWLLAAVGRPHPQLRFWRDARLWMWFCAGGAPASALLAWWSQYVPWWEYHRVAGIAARPALLVIPATFAAFMHLAYLASGSGVAVLPLCCRVAAVLGALGVSAFCLRWPPMGRLEPQYAPHRLISTPMMWTVVSALYLLPLTVLPVAVYVLLRNAGRKAPRAAG